MSLITVPVVVSLKFPNSSYPSVNCFLTTTEAHNESNPSDEDIYRHKQLCLNIGLWANHMLFLNTREKYKEEMITMWRAFTDVEGYDVYAENWSELIYTWLGELERYYATKHGIRITLTSLIGEAFNILAPGIIQSEMI